MATNVQNSQKRKPTWLNEAAEEKKKHTLSHLKHTQGNNKESDFESVSVFVSFIVSLIRT